MRAGTTSTSATERRRTWLWPPLECGGLRDVNVDRGRAASVFEVLAVVVEGVTWVDVAPVMLHGGRATGRG